MRVKLHVFGRLTLRAPIIETDQERRLAFTVGKPDVLCEDGGLSAPGVPDWPPLSYRGATFEIGAERIVSDVRGRASVR